MSDADAISAPPPVPDTAPRSAPQPPQIDIDRLAEKVYRLMLADLRQEQARRGGKR